MKKIGKVVVIGNRGTILVRSNKTFRLNSPIVNQEIKSVGKIVDIIGPEKHPYLVINTRYSEIKAKKGEMLYLLDRAPKKKSNYKSKSYSKKRR